MSLTGTALVGQMKLAHAYAIGSWGTLHLVDLGSMIGFSAGQEGPGVHHAGIALLGWLEMVWACGLGFTGVTLADQLELEDSAPICAIQVEWDINNGFTGASDHGENSSTSPIIWQTPG